jgi:acetoin utilization deacetylase AcuC-like enzyme
MVADSQVDRCRAAGASPSAWKPAAVIASWLEKQLPIEIVEPAPITVEQLCRVHDRKFVEDVITCRAANGFGNRSPEVAASLLYTNGSMYRAAQDAFTRGGIACAPCSGFHHAGKTAGAFCTFNGLVVAAVALRDEGAQRVGILDLDMHYGNGTDYLIEQHKLDFIVHFTAGKTFHYAEQAADFFRELPLAIRSMSECEVVLYQAGADPHVDDPLGGFLTTAELAERDRIVFEMFDRLGVPVAWNFAGGYQVEPDGSIPRVLEIHENTARAALEVIGKAR